MNKTVYTPTLIIHNARLYDPLSGMLSHSALEINCGRITAIGNDADILSLQRPDSMVINANDRLLLPAFMDSHIHYFEYVKRQQEIKLSNCHSLEEALNLIRERVANTPEGEWITGGGWDRNLWQEEDFPTRHQLDRITTRHYISLDSKDWHIKWVNTPVLELAEIPLDQPYPGAKHHAIEPVTGEFTGVLEESIRLKINNFIPPPDYKKLRKTHLSVLNQFYSLGVNGVHSVDTAVEFEIAQEALRRNELGLRTFWYAPVKHLPSIKELSIGGGLGNDFLRISGVKVFVDGSFGSQTAELLEDYHQLGHPGVENITEEELRDQISSAIEGRLSCAIHAIGDKAIRKALNVLKQYHQDSQRYCLRHRIEHAQLIHPDDIGMVNETKVFVSVQPAHLAGDISIINKYLGERGIYAYPYASLLKTGAKLIFGSDAPIETINPWQAIFTAMQRKPNLDPNESSFFPQEKMNLRDCIRAYTSSSATAVGMANKLGGIQVGMLADLFIPDRDIFEGSTSVLKDTRAVLTVINGQVVLREID